MSAFKIISIIFFSKKKTENRNENNKRKWKKNVINWDYLFNEKKNALFRIYLLIKFFYGHTMNNTFLLAAINYLSCYLLASCIESLSNMKNIYCLSMRGEEKLNENCKSNSITVSRIS